MRRPPAVHVDPEWFADGEIGRQTATFDTYFRGGDERTLAIVADYFVSQLEEPLRSSVEMCVMQNIPYAEAAKYIGEMRGKTTDPKTVWRWAKQGVGQLGRMFEAAKWTGAIEPRIPEEES